MGYEEEASIIMQNDNGELKEIIDDYGEEVAEAALVCGIPFNKISECYSGHYPSDEDFVQEMLEDCGDIPELPRYIHIDWEWTAREVMMDYCSHKGHYFNNNW